MLNAVSRRTLLKFASTVFPVGAMDLKVFAFGARRPRTELNAIMVTDTFPAQPPELVREMVTVAHFDLQRVKELSDARPSLVKAAWDWGFGDWETPLGAASHMGNRAIAEYLLSQGAPPSLFSAAMLGQLEAVKAVLAGQPGVQRVRGPHSISLLAHARMGGEAAHGVSEYLQSLEGADADPPSPLREEDISALLGTYVFGVGVTQQVDLTADLQMYANKKMYTYAPQLNWTRKGTMTRPLFHLGNRTFYPAGAPSVRICFTEGSDGMLMNVDDGELVLSAVRKRSKS